MGEFSHEDKIAVTEAGISENDTGCASAESLG